MAASKKKRVEDEMTEDLEDDMEYESDDDDESDEEEAMEGEVQLDFQARVPEDCDFNGMRTLLQQQPDSAGEGEDDGNDDDDDDTVLALTSVLNLTERKDLGCIKQLKSILLDRCEKCGLDKKNKLDKILSDPDHHVGYLISERYLNLPPTLALPMFESLLKEMEKATQKNMKYKFDYYLMICKTFEMKMGHNKKELYFSNSEEEFFQNVSDFWFRYSVANERDGVVEKWSAEEDMEPFRTVLVFSADKLQTVIGKIKEELAKT